LIVREEEEPVRAERGADEHRPQPQRRQPEELAPPEDDDAGRDGCCGEGEPPEDERLRVQVDAGHDHGDEAPGGGEPRDGQVPPHGARC
jgi:hypothetical protein